MAPIFASCLGGGFLALAITAIRSILSGWDPPGGRGGVVG